ncbi:MAG: Leucyl/phenylalanyl-tRNA--protein transferase [Sodalis sp.]|uniref:hypothetical protein n=1 Tax=Sodalis sp. (in: enterobacteria) TaxID=1898979 RepID=UPI0038734CC8|nr:MAG: Leucyl/phenylalanyl-tRNA--protein transferase [Sodalis sp.]
MVDCQVSNSHTASLGAHSITRGDFLAYAYAITAFIAGGQLLATANLLYRTS